MVPNKENFHSNIMLIKNVQGHEKKFLYDAGSTLSEALLSQSIKENEINTLYISHLDNDHSGGVEDLAFKNYFLYNNYKINLVGTEEFLNKAWNTSWKAGLKYINETEMQLSDYFQVDYLDKEESTIDFYGTKIKPKIVTHTPPENNYGITIFGNKRVFITGDSIFQPEHLMDEYKKADIIFQDCDFNEYEGGVYAQFHQLCTLPNDIKEKMHLYHYSTGDIHIWDFDLKASKQGFAGMVRSGNVFNG